MISNHIVRVAMMLGLSGTAFAKDRKFTVIVSGLFPDHPSLRVSDTYRHVSYRTAVANKYALG